MNNNQTAKIYVMPKQSDLLSADSNAQDGNENVRYYKLNQLNEEIADLRNEKNVLYEMLLSQEKVAASVEEEDDGMEDLKKKIHEMDKKISVIEERVKRLDNLPSGLEIKQIISEAIDSKNLASVDKVELEITKSRNIQILWTIGTIIGVVSLAATIMKLLS
ncbi:TPA: hypothetical protein ACGXP3_003922 [Bacillus cereus]|uniref:hypothetical protein n=1 Tax=Bacillus cereus TaxID=1396 RepID=UPI001EF4A9A4|nr:hypothetical protein [Bacillus cereus]MDA2379499.1 hypothetical protein [Bacillus cereus]